MPVPPRSSSRRCPALAIAVPDMQVPDIPALAILPLSVALLLLYAGAARAQTTSGDVSALEARIQAQQAKLQQEELQLEQQSLELSRQQQLLDSEMATLRGAGTTGTPQPQNASASAPAP